MIARAVILVLIAVATVATCLLSPALKTGTEAGVVMQLPARFGPLVGVSDKPDKEELRLLPGDTQYAKMTYQTANAPAAERDEAHVSIVLAGAERRSIHRPEICLPGQGWTITSSETTSILISPGHDLKVKDLAIEKVLPAQNNAQPLRVRAHYVYWFIGTDTTTPSHAERIWDTTWDSLVRGVNHRWAYASVMAIVTENLSPELSGQRPRTDEQTRRLISFVIQNTVPQFQKSFMPGNPTIAQQTAKP